MNLPVALYYPNILGYIRIGMLFYTLYIAKEDPLTAGIYFILNTVLDAADGFLARHFKQSSAFGAILDYTIDRISVACFYLLLSTIYPDYYLLFSFFLCLDLGSHFFHMKASQNQASHKDIAPTDSCFLRFYYTRLGLYITCFTHDLFLAFLFLYKYYPTKIFLLLTLPGFAFKAFIHTVQWIRASKLLIIKRCGE